jgi:hypothetical protein
LRYCSSDCPPSPGDTVTSEDAPGQPSTALIPGQMSLTDASNGGQAPGQGLPETRKCAFPDCSNAPVAKDPAAPGPAPAYCPDPEHTPLKAWRARQKAARGGKAPTVAELTDALEKAKADHAAVTAELEAAVERAALAEEEALGLREAAEEARAATWEALQEAAGMRAELEAAQAKAEALRGELKTAVATARAEADDLRDQLATNRAELLDAQKAATRALGEAKSASKAQERAEAAVEASMRRLTAELDTSRARAAEDADRAAQRLSRLEQRADELGEQRDAALSRAALAEAELTGTRKLIEEQNRQLPAQKTAVGPDPAPTKRRTKTAATKAAATKVAPAK